MLISTLKFSGSEAPLFVIHTCRSESSLMPDFRWVTKTASYPPIWLAAGWLDMRLGLIDLSASPPLPYPTPPLPSSSPLNHTDLKHTLWLPYNRNWETARWVEFVLFHAYSDNINQQKILGVLPPFPPRKRDGGRVAWGYICGDHKFLHLSDSLPPPPPPFYRFLVTRPWPKGGHDWETGSIWGERY